MVSNIFNIELLSSRTFLTTSLPVQPSKLFLQYHASCFSPFSKHFPDASIRSSSSSPSHIHCSVSSTQDIPSSSPAPNRPPSSREQAISQAKHCLSSTLQKSLNNSLQLATRKLKKLRHPRFRVEIPLADDSPASLTQLALDVFSDLPLRKKNGAKPKFLIMWPSSAVAESAEMAFASSDSVVNSDWVSVSPESLSSADLAVFLSPEISQLDDLKSITGGLYPKPVVLFNPKWGFEEEKDLDGDIESFVSSFDVVYSFMGLEVRGVLSRKRGAVFKCTRDGVVSREGWVVMVEEEGTDDKERMKMVTSFKRRPSISEVENVLYNLMAANSPVTKSVKFLSDLVSNVTGRKAKK